MRRGKTIASFASILRKSLTYMRCVDHGPPYSLSKCLYNIFPESHYPTTCIMAAMAPYLFDTLNLNAGPLSRANRGTLAKMPIWELPKIRGTLLGVPIIRMIIFWGPYWGPLFWESTISEFSMNSPKNKAAPCRLLYSCLNHSSLATHVR